MTDSTHATHGYFLEDLQVGMQDEFSKVITESDIAGFADVSGDTNPVHLDAEFAATTRFGERIAHGMLSASLISAVIGTRLPGPGCIYMSQDLSFRAPVKIGDTVKAVVTVEEINSKKARVTLKTVCLVDGKEVIRGGAVVWVPNREASE